MTASGFPSDALLPPRPASLGEILDAGFVLFRRTLLRCVPFSLLAVLFGQLPAVYLLRTEQSLALNQPKDLLWWLIMMLSALGTLWTWLVIMLRQRDALQGGENVRPFDVGAARALVLLPRSLALLAIAGIAVLIGLVLFVLPGIYLLVSFWLALPLLVFEGVGARAALDGALQLVRGHWRHLAATLLVVVMSVLALFVIGSLCALLIGQLSGRSALIDDALLGGIVAGVLGALFQPLVIALTLAAYADLRHRRSID